MLRFQHDKTFHAALISCSNELKKPCFQSQIRSRIATGAWLAPLAIKQKFDLIQMPTGLWNTPQKKHEAGTHRRRASFKAASGQTGLRQKGPIGRERPMNQFTIPSFQRYDLCQDKPDRCDICRERFSDSHGLRISDTGS